MNVGDLVRYIAEPLYLGLVIDFDKDGDPIIEFFDQDIVSSAYYDADIEVLNEIS
jgi:hypothetical protein